MRAAFLILAVISTGTLVGACASRPGAAAGSSLPAVASVPVPAPESTRDPSKDSLPLVAEVHLGASDHTWRGADDHVTLTVDNRGRDIQDLVIASPAWVAEHGLAMGSTRSCLPNLDAGQIACGPIYSGKSMPVILRAMPAHVGSFHYELRVYDREGDNLLPVAGTDGRPVVFDFVEVVDPLTNQVPGGSFTPEPSPPT